MPNAAEVGGSSGPCDDLGLRGLADIAGTGFSPVQVFSFGLDPVYRGETVKINTVVEVQMRNTYLDICNPFGCSCSKLDQNSDAGGPFTVTHSISLPQAPDGPVGDDTCTDGIDNDLDGDTDSADNQC